MLEVFVDSGVDHALNRCGRRETGVENVPRGLRDSDIGQLED